VTRAGPVIDFDQHSVDYRNRWRDICDANLALCPVARTEANGGYWVISGYDPLRAVLRDHRAFSSRWDLGTIRTGPAGISIPPGPFPKFPAELDPPEFTPYRRLIGQAMSPERSGRWAPLVRRMVEAGLDRANDAGELDFVRDLTVPLATAVAASVLGLPLDGYVELAGALHTVEYARAGGPDFEPAAGTLVRWADTVTSVIRARRATPAPDLIGDLATCRIDGDLLPIERVVGICYLVMGSVDNTAGFIASALLWLSENPDRRRELAGDPGLIPAAVDELLRYLAPIHGLARTATRDVDLAGRRIRRGDRVWLHFAAANRDPAVFPDPDAVRFDRAAGSHASFGFGIHRCVGAPLTRLQASLSLEMVLAVAPDYAVRQAGTRRYTDIGKFNGFERMAAVLGR